MGGGPDQDGPCPSLCCPADSKRAIIDHQCLCWPDTKVCEDLLIVGWPLLENSDQVCTIATTKTLLHAESLEVASDLKGDCPRGCVQGVPMIVEGMDGLGDTWQGCPDTRGDRRDGVISQLKTLLFWWDSSPHELTH